MAKTNRAKRRAHQQTPMQPKDAATPPASSSPEGRGRAAEPFALQRNANPQPEIKQPQIKTPVTTKSQTEAARTQPAARRWELLAFAGIIAIAVFARFFKLGALPSGLHGDEGVMGMKAMNALRGTWPGVFVPECAGFPAGSIYFAIPFVAMLGREVVAPRAGQAFAGVLATLALWAFARWALNAADAPARERDGLKPKPRERGWTKALFSPVDGALGSARPVHGRATPTKEEAARAAVVALLATLIFAVSNWDVHLSRVGFALSPWPLFATLGAWSLLFALRRRTLGAWFLGGAGATLGFYIYNVHALFWVALSSFALWQCVNMARKRDATPAQIALWATAWLLATLVVITPLALYVRAHPHEVFDHFGRDSLWSSPDWINALDVRAKANVLLGRYFGWWKAALFVPANDNYIDSLGFAPLLAWPFLPLAILGAWLGRRRAPTLVSLCVWICLLMPLSAVVSVGGNTRRPFALLPFWAILCALGVYELGARLSQAPKPAPRLALTGLLAAWLMVGLGREAWLYWGVQPGLPEQSWVYCRDYTRAVEFARTLPPDSYIMFSSDRWNWNYEPRQWLAPDLQGEDRLSRLAPPRPDPLSNDGHARAVWILMDHQELLPQLQVRYPGGRVVRDSPFVAYITKS